MKASGSTPELGAEIRRLRLLAASSLRGLAARLEVSAAHLSDIEHDRRRPSEKLLRKIARELKPVGASFESLHELITGIDPETRDWVATTPGVRRLLLKVRESGRSPHKILLLLEETVLRDHRLGKPATPSEADSIGKPSKPRARRRSKVKQ
jgi:transcriptional regulator with XRE-family HTH domain